MTGVQGTSVTARLRGFMAQMNGEQRVWALTTVIALLAGLAAWTLRAAEVLAARSIPIWLLATMFYAAEITVVHVKFKRNTQSFSMSEIPLVVGLFFVAPLGLMLAQLLQLGHCQCRRRATNPQFSHW